MELKFHGIFLCFLKDEIREQIKAEIYERNNSDQDTSVRWIYRAKGSYETGRNGLVESIIKITGRSFFFSSLSFFLFFPSNALRLISVVPPRFCSRYLSYTTLSLRFVVPSLFLEEGARIHFHIARMTRWLERDDECSHDFDGF